MPMAQGTLCVPTAILAGIPISRDQGCASCAIQARTRHTLGKLSAMPVIWASIRLPGQPPSAMNAQLGCTLTVKFTSSLQGQLVQIVHLVHIPTPQVQPPSQAANLVLWGSGLPKHLQQPRV